MKEILQKIMRFFTDSKYRFNSMVKIGFYNNMDDETFIKKSFYINMGYELNLDNPMTFNEKLQWLKLNDRNPEYTKMVDKYEAKKYVASIIGEEYIIPTIGIYDKFEDIDFDKLPNQFVIKCTHDSGGLVICKDKAKLDIKAARKKINKCLKRSYYYFCREWTYKNVKPRIIIEEYMKDKGHEELIDYKFFCCSGEPKFLYVSEGLSDHKTAKISFTNINYEIEEFHRKDYKPFEKLPDKPKNFEKMKEFAKILSNDIIFLRVDFYEINKKVYFGELTFCPCGGCIPFEPNEWDRKLGDMLVLSQTKMKKE